MRIVRGTAIICENFTAGRKAGQAVSGVRLWVRDGHWFYVHRVM